MPGTIPNQNILDSIDQVIQALNDLATEVSGNVPDLTTIEGNIQTVGDNLEGVSDAIVAQTTTQETRSVAEVTAQNTNFSDLVAAINGLSLICAPEINVESATPDIYTSCPAPIVQVNCGAGSTGSALDGGAVDYSDPPPEGYEPDPNIDNRKCKASNQIYDVVYASVEVLEVNHVQDYGATLITIAITLTSVLLGASMGSIFPGVGTVIGGVVGAIVGIVTSLITNTAIDLENVLTVMSTNRADLICALYGATNTDDARSEVLSILETGGINSYESLLLESYFFPNDLLKVLFQAIPGSEAALDGYEVTIDCVDCVEGCDPSLDWGYLDPGYSWIASTNVGGSQAHKRIQITFSGCWRYITLNAVNGWTVTAFQNDDVYINTPSGVVSSDNPATHYGTPYCCNEFTIRSSTAFHGNFTIGSECNV